MASVNDAFCRWFFDRITELHRYRHQPTDQGNDHDPSSVDHLGLLGYGYFGCSFLPSSVERGASADF